MPTPGISSGFKWLHGALTFGVAMPSFITAFTVAASLEYAARRRGGSGLFCWWGKLPYFDRDRYLFAYLFTGLVLFFFGGITGIINASVTMNNVVHNTAWVPAHFHTTLGGPAFLAFLGMSVFLVAQLTGKRVRFPTPQPVGSVSVDGGNPGVLLRPLGRRPARRAAAHEPRAHVRQSRLAALSPELADLVARRRCWAA